MLSQEKVTPAHKPHGRTAARIANIKMLVDALRVGSLLRDEIGALLKLSPSGVRKYIKELRELYIIEIERFIDGTATTMGYPLFRLVPDDAHISAFIAEIECGIPEVKRARAGKPSNLEVALRDQKRHFHILADDTHYAIRISRSPVMRDPLVAAFFGAPRAHQHQVGA